MGSSGIGKSSFIKAIIQTCEDIVHVDPVPTNTSTAGARGSSSTSSFYTINDRSEGGSTKAITEIYASTKPYPHWWSEHEDSKVLKRRKSTAGDIVLERNVCFVDTPGYGSATSVCIRFRVMAIYVMYADSRLKFLECVTPVVRYVETQMERTQAILSNGDGGLLSLLSGNGTPQVDIVFYVILHSK